MELKGLWWWVVLVLVWFHKNGCFGCWEQERIALLQLKASINYPNGPSLPSWEDTESDCCHWERVQCNITTQHVIKLSLNSTRDYTTDYRLEEWYFNASLFLPFKELRDLDLSGNGLVGWVGNEGFERLVGLEKLQVLSLDWNRYNNSILPYLGVLSSLKTLHIRHNELEGSIHIQGTKCLNKLRVLGLKGRKFYEIYFNASVLQSLRAFPSLKNLSIGVEGLVTAKADSKYNINCNSSRIRHVHLNKNGLGGPWTGCSSLVTLELSDNNLIGTIPDWISNLSALSILLLKGNHFEGEIPTQLCHLNQITMINLSHNTLVGPIPRCLINITFKAATNTKSFVESESLISPTTRGLALSIMGGPEFKLVDDTSYYDLDPLSNFKQQVEFPTKSMSYVYKGNVLDLMSGVDFSCNQLTGEIPVEIGNLTEIHVLNLSHNSLIGSIPSTCSNLRNVESLDLSYNNLNGSIPSQLTDLNSLAVFSLAHNNLSGKTPDRKAQFITFDESSYEGNPHLCGPPLQNNCTVDPELQPPTENGSNGDDGFIDLGVFYISFSVSYVSVLLVIVAVLYINPHWRRVWFNFIEVRVYSCYYFVVDSFRKLFNYWNM